MTKPKGSKNKNTPVPTEAQVEAIVNLYLGGASAGTVARSLGFTEWRVTQVIRDKEIVRPPTRRRNVQ